MSSKPVLIGTSTGVVWQEYDDLGKRVDSLLKTETQGIEINVYGFDLLDPEFSNRIFEKIEHLPFFTIHLDSKKNGDDYINLEIIEALRKIKQRYQNLLGIVIHPDCVGNGNGDSDRYFMMARESGLPFVIENMDYRRPIHHNLEYMQSLLEYGLDFIVDLQHVYEIEFGHEKQPPNPGYAEKLFEMMEGKIKYLHLSGGNGKSIHHLVHDATNRDQIIDWAKKLSHRYNVPIILEGVVPRDGPKQDRITYIVNKVNDEIRYVREQI